MKKRLLATLMTICLLVGSLPTVALAATEGENNNGTITVATQEESQEHTHDESCYDENGELICGFTEIFADTVEDPNVFTVGSDAELRAAITAINAAESGSFVISLNDDVYTTTNENFKFTANETTLLGNGHTVYLSIQTAQDGIPIEVSSGAVLNLGTKDDMTASQLKITGAPNGDPDYSDHCLVYLTGGTLNMYDGVSLSDFAPTHGGTMGAAVQFAESSRCSGSTFNMYGGEISNNEASGVLSMGTAVLMLNVDSSSTFNLYGGTIKNNRCTGASYKYGGAVMVNNGTFNMYGGTITENSATYGGGVYLDSATFNMKAGKISNNTADGISKNKAVGYGGGIYSNSTSTINITGGNISENEATTSGGGVYGAGSVSINGSTIQQNTAAYGGGVCGSSASAINIIGGNLSGNTATTLGGGVYGAGSVSINGCTIHQNTANYGGGIYKTGTAALSLRNTEIQANNAKAGTDPSSSGIGGGIAVFAGSLEASSEGNIICNNTADTAAADVYTSGDSTSVLLPDAAKMNQIYAADGKNKLIDGWYEDGETRYTPSLYAEAVSVGSAITEEACLVASYTFVPTKFLTYQYQGDVPTDAPAVPDGAEYEPGVEVDIAAAPALDGWVFSGWSVSTPEGTAIENGKLTMPDSDVVLVGSWNRSTTPVDPKVAAYKVEHYKEQVDGSYALEETEFPLYGEIDETVNATPKTYENYHHNENAPGTLMSGTVTMPTLGDDGTPQILTLKVYYELDTYEVKYDLNGGDANGKDYSTVTVKHGTDVTVKDAPKKSGYTFDGWSDGTVTHQPGAQLTVLGNITLTAQWHKNGGSGGGGTTYYTLRYESNGGTKYKDERYTSGTTVQLDKIPTREGYAFSGWYGDEALTNRISKIKMTSNKTVYAGWRAISVPDMLNGDDHIAYVVGYTDGNVGPLNNITRAETATIFFRLLKESVRNENLTRTNTFDDVSEEMWCNIPISTMAKLGVVTGRTPGFFDPNTPITRGEFATICARFDTGVENGQSSFTDISGHWAETDIERAATLGWIKGYADGTFRPENYITRAEAMTMINRVLCRVPENEDDLLDGMIIWPDNNPGSWYYLAVQEATNSHDFEYKDEIYEHWTKLTADPDWKQHE